MIKYKELTPAQINALFRADGYEITVVKAELDQVRLSSRGVMGWGTSYRYVVTVDDWESEENSPGTCTVEITVREQGIECDFIQA